MFEDVDAKDDVVLRALDLDLSRSMTRCSSASWTTSSLGLQHVDADDVDRFPNLETLLTGLDVQHFEDPVTREDRVDESLCSSAFDIARPDFSFVLEVTHRRA